MCGICGKLNFDGAPVSAALLGRMSDTLVHRGPDDSGMYLDGGIGLAERRLAVIDLSPSATAPLCNEDGTFWVVFNGEIYNHRELRATLQARGHDFRTRTDTEVLVHLYEDYGPRAVAHLCGMFAFVLWDGRRRLLYGARDRLGKKPLAYALTAQTFVFGSEIKAVLQDPAISVEPDLAAIDAYLTYQYVPSPRSAFAGISKLPAGHYFLCGSDGSLRVERYWTPPRPHSVPRDAGEVTEELRAHLREAVRLRLEADVPVGAFLSGGIDSGTVVALMSELASERVRTFSIGFEDEAFNELAQARLVAARYDTDHHEFMVRPDAASVLPDLVYHYNEPFADPSAVPTYYVAKLARKYVTVALTGDGGDESFAGYDSYEQVSRWSVLDPLPRRARVAIGRGASAVLANFPHHRAARVERAFAMAAGDVPQRFTLSASIWKPQEKRVAYAPEFTAALREGAVERDPAALWYGPNADPVAWMMFHDQQFYLPDCLMVKTDIASMANSLEVRCPLLDHRLVEFAASIPTELKVSHGQRKRILKQAVHDLLPREILNKPKTGFGLPVARWLRTDLKALLEECVLDERAARRGIFRAPVLRQMVDQHQAHVRDWSARLWAVLMLELWFRAFIDTRPAS